MISSKSMFSRLRCALRVRGGLSSACFEVGFGGGEGRPFDVFQEDLRNNLAAGPCDDCVVDMARTRPFVSTMCGVGAMENFWAKGVEGKDLMEVEVAVWI